MNFFKRSNDWTKPSTDVLRRMILVRLEIFEWISTTMALASASKNCPLTVTALNPFLDRMYADSSEFTRIIFPKIKFFKATSFSSHCI